MSARVGILLSGCGVLDGSELHEAVSILIALDRRGARPVMAAPDKLQSVTLNHRTRQPQSPPRNVLEESARIARGNIQALSTLASEDLEALIFPGGYGVARNLSSFATDGPTCQVDGQVERILLEMHSAGKPIGLACIAPVLAARVLGSRGIRPKLTLGADSDAAAALQAMGAEHHPVGPNEIYVDEAHKLVSTPCYMNDVGPWVVYQGATAMVEEVLRLAGDPASIVREHLGKRPK